MRALVTGSAGFIGRHFVRHLESLGWRVVQCDIAAPASFVAWQDARECFAMEGAQFDLVVHAAARGAHRKAIDTQPENYPYNLSLDAAMFEWAIRTEQCHVLYLSSCAVYSDMATPMAEFHAADPRDPYAWTKWTGEQMAQTARRTGLGVTVVRPFSGYGEDQAEDWPFGAFIARARRREDPFTIWGSGAQVRDWIHVSDIVVGSMALLSEKVDGPVNLCTGIGHSMTTVVSEVCRQAGYNPAIKCTETDGGAVRRVGDPALLHEFYLPRVSLAEGIARALA